MNQDKSQAKVSLEAIQKFV